MSADIKTQELQNQGTREFEEAISGKGPKMPKNAMYSADEDALNKALEGSFPARVIRPSPPHRRAASAHRRDADPSMDQPPTEWVRRLTAPPACHT